MTSKILCYGDSLTYGYGVPDAFVWHQLIKKRFNIEIINCGANGAMLTGMKLRLDNQVISKEKDAVLFMGGTNDLISGRLPEDVKNDIGDIFKKIIDDQPNSVLIIPPPAIVEMAQKSWDSMGEYEQLNQSLKMIGSYFADVYEGQVISMYQAFMDLEEKHRLSLFSDGVHLNEQGHCFFAEIIIAHSNF